MKKVLPLIIVLFSAINIYSQYKGGVGDGHSSNITTNIFKIVANAGSDITICGADTVTIGSAAGVNKTYSWTRLGSPMILANTAIYKFYASTIGINRYILKVDSLLCSVYDTVIVRVDSPMSQLSVSTGYNAHTSTTIPYNPIPLRDNCWKVIQTPNSADFRLPTDIVPYPSYVVLGLSSYNSASASDTRLADGHYISPNPSANAGINLSPEVPVVFQRNFSTTTNGSIRIVGELLADNYAELYLNNTLIKTQNTAQYSTNFLNPMLIDTVLSINAGVHSLKINLRNSSDASTLGVRFSGLLMSCNSNIIDDNCYAAPPTVSAGPDRVICLGDSVLIGTPGDAATVYSWAILNGATFYTGNSQIKVAPTVTTTYVLTGINSGGSQSDNVTVTVNPKPDATISGNFNVCTDAIYYYSVPNVPGNVYEWNASGGVIVSDFNDRYEVRIQWGSVGVGTISVKVRNQFGCESEKAQSITINALPTASISYPSPLCAETRTVNVIQTGQNGGYYSATPYDLLIDMNSGAISITNTTIGTYTITYEIDNGICSNSVTTQIIINSIPATPVITATNTCAGGIGQGTISTSTSTSGVGYQLFNNSDNSTIGLPMSGNGGVLIWESLNAGTYYVIATDLGTNCSSSRSNNATIANYPPPVATLISNDADNIICNGETITFTAGGGVNYEFIINGVSQGTPSTTNTLTINTPVNGQAVKVKVYDSNGCTAESSDIIVTVTAAPQAVATPSTQAICSGETTAIALSSLGNPAGITYSWTTRLISGTVNGFSSSSGNTIAQTLTNTGNIPATVRYAVVSKIGVCLGDTTFVNIVVNPKPNAIATPMTQTICSGESTSITISTTGTPSGISYSWTAKIISGNVSGLAGGSGSSISQVLTNTGITQAIVRYAIAPKVGTCLGDTIFADVTINPKPNTIATPTAQTICSGETTAINLSTNVSGVTVSYSWIATCITGNVTGFLSASGSSINQVLTNTGSSVALVRYALVAKIGTCSGDTSFVVVTVNPKPNAIATPQAQTINNGAKTNIAITSGVSDPSLTFTWTAKLISGIASGFIPSSGNVIAQTLTNSGTTSAIVRYAVVPKIGSCLGDTVYVDITINPTADVIIQQNTDALCSGGTTDIRLSTNSTSTNISYSWIASTIIGTVSGQSNGSGSNIAQTLTNAESTPAIVRYTITPTIDGILGRAAIANVTVYPTPTFNTTPESQIILSGEKSNIALSTGIYGANVSYIWSAKLLNGAASGYTDGVGSLISQTLTNSGTIPARVQYTITPIIANCLGTPKTVDVTVNPIIRAIATPIAQTICSGETTSIALSSNISGTGIIYNWVATKISGSIEGYSNGNGNEITQKLTNTGTTPAKVSYEITPKLGELTGTPVIVEITVLPQATVSVSLNSQTISSGSECNIALSSPVSGIEVLYEWISNCPSVSVTGYSPGSGNKISQTLINSGNKPETVLYTITPKVGECTGMAKTVEVTVNPEADVNVWQESDAICNEGTTNIKLSTNVSGATVTYSWTASAQSTDVSGYSPGSGESINDKLINSCTTPQTVRYTIAPTINGVVGNSVVADVTVYPTPIVISTPKSQAVASGQECDIRLTSNVSDANVSFVWEAESISGPVSGYSPGSGNTIAQTLTNLGNTPAIVRYRIIPNIEGCLGIPDSVDITVNPEPKVTVQNLSDTICHDGITNIKLSTPISGVEVLYAWTSSSDNNNITGNTDGDGIGDIITDNLMNTDNISGKVIYTITPMIDGVSGTAFSTEVVVYPKPNVMASPQIQTINHGEVCTINLSTDITDEDVNYTWEAECISGYANGYESGNGNSIIQQLTNSGTTSAIVRYKITPMIGSCLGDVITVDVSIIQENQPAEYHISLDTVKVQIESKAKLNLKLLSSENLIRDGINRQFTARISFNSSMMKPQFDYSIPEWQSDAKSYRTIEFIGSTDKSSGVLTELLFDTNLGNDSISSVIIESVIWSDIKGDYFSILDNGRVELLGICYENGPRLFEPSDPVQIRRISPNPANDRIEIEFSVIENDKTELIIMNMLGEVVKTIPIAINTLGIKTEIISLDNLAQGQYMIILKTPTIREERLIKIVK